ncbi:MAG: hypothetical protein ACFFB3_01660 [Candidatus Hodarchaeota archaeon]
MLLRHTLKAKWIVTFILAALVTLTPYYNQSVAGSDDKDAPIVILYDLGHGQFFNQTFFSKAFKALDDLKNDSNCDCEFVIRYSYGNFSSTILSGVDILVMTNPAKSTTLNDPDDVESRERQQYALAHWFLQGKGIFLLSNPFDKTNESLSGHPTPLLRVIRSQYLQVSGVEMGANYLAHNSSDVINGVAPFSEFSNINASSSSILSQPQNVSRLITKTATVRASVEDNSKGIEILKANLTSFAVDENGRVGEVDRKPSIFATINYEPNEDDYDIINEDVASAGRIALSGSTLMFSDLPAQPGSTDSWIDLANNKQLWINTMLWLAGKTQVTAPPVVDEKEDFPIPVTFSILAISTIGLLVLGTGTHFYGASRPLEPLKEVRKAQLPEKEKEKRPTGAKKPRRQLRRKKK